MILITGGVYQGKRALADKLAEENPGKMEILDNCDKKIRQQLKEGHSPKEILELWAHENEESKILIFNDVSLGIVPIEKEERIFRETTGQVGVMLAEKADSVYRVFCGIPKKIK